MAEVFKCPNCNNNMIIEYDVKYIKPFGYCVVYGCEDCSHIQVLDWLADSKEDLLLNYNIKVE